MDFAKRFGSSEYNCCMRCIGKKSMDIGGSIMGSWEGPAYARVRWRTEGERGATYASRLCRVSKISDVGIYAGIVSSPRVRIDA